MNWKDICWDNPRKLARILSLVENRNNEAQVLDLMDVIYPKTGQAHVLGITGAPGAGKSSLVNALVKELRKEGIKIGIIAVDPSSPFTGGAILGDRVRMQDHCLDKGVFIRSMASRGSLGGVGVSTREAVSILDAAGFDLVIVETIGVGQSEIDIVKMADTVMLVLTPNAGDSIQTLKAGIMEIGNIFVINKSDLQGSDQIYREIEVMLDFHYHNSIRNKPEIFKTSIPKSEGIFELVEAVGRHKKSLKEQGVWSQLRRDRAERQFYELIQREVERRVCQEINRPEREKGILEQVKTYQISPHTAARKMVEHVMR